MTLRKTKIVCTLGPSTEKDEVLRELILSGMNVARLNFSHGTYPEHEKKIALIKKVRQKLGLPIAMVAGLPGLQQQLPETLQEKYFAFTPVMKPDWLVDVDE